MVTSSNKNRDGEQGQGGGGNASPCNDVEKRGGAGDENVKVVVRIRPLNDKEMNADYRNIIDVDGIHGTIRLHNLNQSRESPPKLFTFDSVFGPDSTQVNRYFELSLTFLIHAFNSA